MASAALRAGLPRELRVLVCGAFLVAVGYGMVAPALPTYARSFDVGVTAASAIVSAFAVARIAFAPFSGWIVGRRGEVSTFCAGLVIVALSSTACAFAADYAQLLVFRAAGGLGSTLFTVSSASLLIRISPPTMRGRASGAWATGFLSGTIAGPVFGGWLMESDLRAPFLVYAGMLLLTVLVIGISLRGRIGVARNGQIGPTATFTAAIRHASFRAALISNVLNGWTVYGVRVALVPLFVVDVLRRSDGWSGPVLAAFAAGTGATLLLGGRLSDRKGRRPPILIGSSVVAITSLWIGLTGSTVELLAAALLSGAGTGLVNPPVNASVSDIIARDGRDVNGGTALAGFQMVGDIGAVIGPIVSGVVAEMSGYPAAFATGTVIALLSVLLWLRAPETRPR